MRVYFVIGALLAATAILAGAFGAHALRDQLGEESLAVWHTAVRYHFWHALALVSLSLLVGPRAGRWPLGLFVVGVVLFSGSLYALALGGGSWLGPLTPLGGLCLVGGWITLAFRGWEGRREGPVVASRDEC
ncbi:MAG: DUF423 domain-containing protein [Acidobacteriota bacterium]|nr:DUF423 domain-containing protein [Acidobacteriota bacterium]